MRTALISTSVNIPTVLSLYRRLGPDVEFFITGDHKTPVAAYEFCKTIPKCHFYSPQEQMDLGYKSSELIGWNSIARRNIALLEAVKGGADVIVSIDDDNFCVDKYYFHDFERLFAEPFDGLMVGADNCWFDPGQWQFPRDGVDPVVQRGFPQSLMSYDDIKPAVGARIGLAQGVILGDPDTSAIDRISRHPIVHHVSELLRSGCVVNNQSWTVVNTQNTAYLRELASCFLMAPQFSRYDDIYASLICQRVMRERGLYVHEGKPFVWQSRNQHDLLKDLAAEAWGAENIVQFVKILDATVLGGRDVLTDVRKIWEVIAEWRAAPSGTAELAEAWCTDVSVVT